MKVKIKNFIKKNKKYLIVVLIGLVFMLAGYISWDVYFSKFEIFKKEEKQLLEAGKRYYQFRKQYLPNEGEYREVSLKALYDNVEMEALYAPKSKKICSLDSWVRVYKKDGEYHYIYYLDCGKFKSKIDHEAPTMKLNGDDVVYVSLGTPYEELGVEEVKDNKDGKIDIKNVEIDSTKVDTSHIGEYEVTYTVKDSTYNRTIVTRKVVVSQSLTNTVKSIVGQGGFYRGNSNNYLLFSGMRWRIVKVNEDGTVKIILDQPSSNLRVNYDKYENSNVDIWLNEYFYERLTNPDKYVVEKEYCVGNINSMSDYGTFCDQKVTRKVGMLDIYEYYMTTDGSNSSIYSKSFMLAHKFGNMYADATFGLSSDGASDAALAPIRPVIVLNDSMTIIEGDGTETKPYKLNDYVFADKGTNLNERIIGEYFEYSGLKFRIIDINDDKDVTAIMSDLWLIQPSSTAVYLTYTETDNAAFNVKEDNNPGYMLNNEYIDYIDAKKIKSIEYDVPTNDNENIYKNYKLKKVKAKIVLPMTYDIFSSSNEAAYMYPYIDTSEDKNSIFVINGFTGQVIEIGKNSYNEYMIKAKITVDGNLRIESGKGTINSPYKLSR